MSIRDVDPVGWAWDYAMDCWREVFIEDADEAPNEDEDHEEEENEPDEDWRESCLTARERN
jgi:hypothetical protein